jgi:hypothetical protein
MLREQRRLRVFDNRMLRRIFGPKRDKVAGKWSYNKPAGCSTSGGTSHWGPVEEEDGNGENFIIKTFMICTPNPLLCG